MAGCVWERGGGGRGEHDKQTHTDRVNTKCPSVISWCGQNKFFYDVMLLFSLEIALYCIKFILAPWIRIRGTY